MLDMHNTMLENGLDFILDACNQLKIFENTKDEIEKRRSIKYNLLHLVSGIELVMKARLFLDNWTYIFSKMDEANRRALNRGTLKSVEYSKCVERLKKLCDVNVADQDAFEDLRQSRNQVEHFYTTESFPAIESKINRALSATVKFLVDNYDVYESPPVVDLRKNMNLTFTDSEKKLIEDINTAVNELRLHHQEAVEFAIKRTEEIRLSNELYICPDCKEKVLVVADENEDDKCHCFLCGYKNNGEETARDYLLRVQGIDEYITVKDGGEYPLYDCPDCGKQSLIKIGSKYICFSCRMEYGIDEVRFCTECGTLYTCFDRENNGICNNCKKYLIEKMENE